MIKKKKDIFANRQFSEKVKEAIRTWLTYKKERRESYKPMGLTTFLNKAERAIKAVGEAEVIRVIEESVANGYVGVVWENVKKKSGQSTTNKNFGDKDYNPSGRYDHLIFDPWADEKESEGKGA